MLQIIRHSQYKGTSDIRGEDTQRERSDTGIELQREEEPQQTPDGREDEGEQDRTAPHLVAPEGIFLVDVREEDDETYHCYPGEASEDWHERVEGSSQEHVWDCGRPASQQDGYMSAQENRG